jgi:two-component system phosphate regulon sensor histidine kinase PhoR
VQALVGFAAIATAALVFARLGRQASAGTMRIAAGKVDQESAAALLAALPVPLVIVAGPQAVVAAFNAAAQALAPGLRTGVPLLLAWRVPALEEGVRRSAGSGRAERVEFMHKLPVARWFEADIVPLGEAGAARHAIVVRDLTPLRRVEEMRADFIANASHELRTPLAALSGFIQTLQGAAREDTAAREKFLPVMAEQAARMGRLIDDLLSLSRIEVAEHIRPETPVDIVAVVREVVAGLAPLARDRGVEIAVAAPPDRIIVAGARDELVRMFENLVENALKYGGSGGRVEIALSEEAKEVSVAVRDFGPGIAPEHLPRLTERFYRVDAGQSRSEGGTGLGLSLVKHILNRHGGQLGIESAPGKGATFTVRLPLVAA